MASQRLSLKYIATWNIGLGRYHFMVDEKGLVDKGLVCYFDVPRYLIREIIGHAILLFLNIFNKRAFLKEWIDLSVKLGRVSGIRKSYKVR